MAIARQIDRRPVPDVPYRKDPNGRVSIDCDAELTPLAHNESGVARSHVGCVLVNDGEPVRVLIEVAGEIQECVARFTASARPTKLCNVRVSVRAEADADEPDPPAPNPVEE